MLRTGLLAAAALLSAGAAVAQPAPLVLELSCDGVGTRAVEERDNNGTIGDLSDDRKHTRQVEGSGRLRLRFGPEGDRMKIPATLGGGADEWLKLTNVAHDENRISAEYKWLLWRTKVLIDRRTGDVDLSGNGGVTFSGTCQKISTETLAPKF